MKNYFTGDKKGFTLVETLVAIGILVTVIIGTTSAIQTGISYYIYSKEQVVAFYLAQEGFEQIRNVRDENSLNGRHWLSGISELPGDPCFFDNNCIIDTVNDTIERCILNICENVKQHNTLGFYGHGIDPANWSPTNFNRFVTLRNISPTEISIEVTVDWSKGLITRQFSAEENLFNWQGN